SGEAAICIPRWRFAGPTPQQISNGRRRWLLQLSGRKYQRRPSARRIRNSRKQAKVRQTGIAAKEHRERENNPKQKGLRAIQIKLHELGMQTDMVGARI